MSVGFGFSAGDFIQALGLVRTVINALRESNGAGPEFRELTQELSTLESALLLVQGIELDEDQNAEGIALRQAASQCQQTIEAFEAKIDKYQIYMRVDGSGSKVKDGWMKIRWAVYEKHDLLDFKARLRGHTSTIELLTTAIQLYVSPHSFMIHKVL